MTDDVSAPETFEVLLLRDRDKGLWFNANLGWVGDIDLATIVSEQVVEVLSRDISQPPKWEVVRMANVPF